MPDELEVFLKEHRRRQNPYNDFIEDSAERHNVDPDMVRAMMHQESSNKKGAVSHKGASGLMQLMPATAQRLGVKNIFDPKENIEGGTKYARKLLDMFGGNVELALAGYNAGEGAVQKYGNKVPPYRETQDYVKRIRGNYQGKGYKHDPLEQFIQKSRPAIDTSTLKPTIPLEDFVEDFRKQNPTSSPTFPTSQPIASPPPAGALTDAGYQSRPVQQQAVTETDDTIQSQINSALDDKVKTRYGVLTTSTEQNGQLFNAGFKAFPVGNEMLWLNVPKILKNKKLGIKDEKHLRQYVEKNGEKALTQFIGIAKPVDDTSNGVAVTAETNGVENASAVVTDEASAQHQAANYADQFPKANIGLKTTDDIAADRISKGTDELIAIGEAAKAGVQYGEPQQVRGGGVVGNKVVTRRNETAYPETQPASTKYDEKEYQVYLESMRLTGRSPLSFADFVRTHPAKQAQSFTNIEGENEDGQEQRAPTGQGINDNTDLGTVTVNPKWSDEEKVRYALSKILPNYDVTPQEIEDWIAQAKGRLSDDPRALVLHPGDKTIADFTVRGQTLKQIKGEFKPSTPEEIAAREKKEAGMALTDDELRAKAKTNVWDNPLSGGTDADIQAEYERLKRTELSSDEKASAVSVGDFIKTIMDAPMGGAFGSGGKEGQKIASGTISGLIESVGGRGSEFVSGLYRYSLPGLIQRGIGQVTGQEDFTADKITKFANQAKVVGVSAKGDGILYDVGNVGGNLTGDVPRLVGLTVLSGGNPVIAFGVDEFLRSAGRGETIGEQAKYAIKGAVLGAIFHGASRLGASVEEGLTTALLPKQSVLGLEKGYRPNVDIALVTKLAGESVRVGTIGTGTFATSKLEGASTKEALYNTALMLLTDLGFNHKKYGQMADMSGKVFRLWKNGEYKDFLVWLKESGAKTEVYDVTGKVSDNNIQAVLSDEMPAGIKNVTPRKPKGSLEGTVEYPQPKEALWKNAENDQPVKVVGEAGKLNGETYYNIEGSKTAVPASEITFTTPATTITDAEPVYKGKDTQPASETQDESETKRAWRLESAQETSALKELGYSEEQIAALNQNDKADIIHQREKPRPTVTESPLDRIERRLAENAKRGRLNLHREVHGAAKYNSDKVEVTVGQSFGRDRFSVNLSLPDSTSNTGFRQNPDAHKSFATVGEAYDYANELINRHDPAAEAEKAGEAQADVAGETQKEPWRMDTFAKPVAERGNRFEMLNDSGQVFDNLYHQSITPPKLDRAEAKAVMNRLNKSDFNNKDSGASVLKVEKNQYILEKTRQEQVEEAFKEGRSVPPEILANYPDLAKKYAKPPAEQDTATDASRDVEGETQASLPAAVAQQQAEPPPLEMKGDVAKVEGVTRGVRRPVKVAEEGGAAKPPVEQAYSVEPAKRGLKNKFVVTTPSTTGTKTREARLVEAAGGRYSGVQGGYVVTESQLVKFKDYLAKGYDASAVTGKLYPEYVQKEAKTAKSDTSGETFQQPARQQTQTPEFKNWFGDSKAVDDKGEPLVVYHGTKADIAKFRRRVGDIGIHFGSAGQANDRLDYTRDRKATEGNENLVPVYLKIRNPIRLPDLGLWNAENINWKLTEIFPSDADRIRRLRSTKDVREYLQSKGYDGVIYRNTGEVEGSSAFMQKHDELSKALTESQKRRGRPLNAFDKDDQRTPAYIAWKQSYQDYSDFREKNATDSYIIFEPSQAKSAIGNRGTFDPNNANILQQPAVSKPFYSRVERTIIEKLPARATPDQIKGLLVKSGIKELDPEYQALTVWLGDQKGVVSKADVQEFVAANKVEVKPVVLGERHPDYAKLRKKIESGDWNSLTPDEQERYHEITDVRDETHFSTYQLPGEKSNYREEFLTAPVNRVVERLASKYGISLEMEGALTQLENTVTDDEWDEWRQPENATVSGNWQDGHDSFSDITNPIGRIRANDRTLANGETLHFSEEFQQPSKDNFAKMPKVYQKYGEHMLLRKHVYNAIQSGADWVGFTTGEQQADRYDLSKHVKQIRTKAWSGGNRKVEIIPVQGADIEIEVTPNGKVVEGYKEFIGKNLDEVVGKELAPQILEAPSDGYKVFSGLDLKVGGQGLARRYDRNAVDYYNKWLKPYGGKVESVEIVPEERPLADIHTVHAIRITPEMVEAFKGGVPFQHLRQETEPMAAAVNQDVRANLENAEYVIDGSAITYRNTDAYGLTVQILEEALPDSKHNSFGVMLYGDQVQKVRDTIADLRKEFDADKEYYSKRVRAELSNFAKTFDKAAASSKAEFGTESVIFAMDDRALAEERTHQARVATVDAAANTVRATQSDEFWNEFDTDPFLKTIDKKLEATYRDKYLRRAEIIDKMMVGEFDALGLDPVKDANEIYRVLEMWHDDTVKKFGKFNARRYEKINEVTNYWLGRGLAAEGAIQTEKASEADGKAADSGVRDDRTAQEVSTNAEAKGTTTDAPAQDAGVKPRVMAISRHLGHDIYYDPQSHVQTEVKAEQLIDRKGVDRAVYDALEGRPSAEGMKVVYDEFARQNALYNHFKKNNQQAEATVAAQELADLAARIGLRQLNTGREIEIAKTFDSLSPDIALLTAQRMLTLKYGDDTKLTQKQIDATNEIAKLRQELEVKLEDANRRLQESASEERRLADDKEPKRPPTTQEQLLKEYKKNKKQIVQKLEELFPDSPLFNGNSAMFQMAAERNNFETDLDPEKQEVVTQYATGQILEGLPYDPLIDTLEQLGLSRADAQQIHSDAIDIIRPARKPRTEAAKKQAKIRAEHYRQAKAFEGKDQPKLSGIAQDAQNDPLYKDNEALIKAIDYLTNVTIGKAGRSLNGLINGIREGNNMSMSEAEELAARAKKAVIDLKAKRQSARDEQKGISETERRNIGQLTVQKRNAAKRMNEHLRQLGEGTQYLVKRFNNLMRGLFVNNYATQLFNAVQSTTVSTPSEMALDGIALALKNGLRIDIGENQDVQAKDLLLPMAYIFSNNKQLATQALAMFPEQYFRIHAGILGDIEIDKVAQAETAHWLTKPLHKVFDLADKGLTKLSHITGAKMQEMHFRNAIIAARFDQIIRVRSKGSETLESALKDGTFVKYVTEKDATKAADDALEVTFASEINDPIGKVMKRAYDQLDNFVPIFLNPVTYARFTYTVTKGMVLNPLAFGAFDAQAAGGRGYNTKSIAKGILGWGGVLTAYALQAALGGDDDRWDTLYINGKDQPPLSVKRFFPLSSYFYVAHLIRQYKEGGTLPTKSDLAEGFASLETDYFMYGAAIGLYDETGRWITGSGSAEEVGQASSRMLGNFFAGATRFFVPLKMAASVIDDEERALRDDSDNAKDKFFGELSRSLPLVIRASDAKKKIDPVTEQPILQPFPAGRAVGLNFVHPSFLSNKDTAATQWAGKYFSYKGNTNDRFTADQRNAYFIKKRLKEAVRRGTITGDDASDKAKRFLAQTLNPQAMGRLQDELKLSELQTYVKYGFGMNPKDIKALRVVWDKATDQEKDELRVVLQKKENLTPEFREEFGLSGAAVKKSKAKSTTSKPRPLGANPMQ